MKGENFLVLIKLTEVMAWKLFSFFLKQDVVLHVAVGWLCYIGHLYVVFVVVMIVTVNAQSRKIQKILQLSPKIDNQMFLLDIAKFKVNKKIVFSVKRFLIIWISIFEPPFLLFILLQQNICKMISVIFFYYFVL